MGDNITKGLWILVSKELGFSLGELGALGGSEQRRTGPEEQQGHMRKQDPGRAVEVMRLWKDSGNQRNIAPMHFVMEQILG